MNPNDYLIQSEAVQSGLIPVEHLESESINEWYAILEDNETTTSLKYLSNSFLYHLTLA